MKKMAIATAAIAALMASPAAAQTATFEFRGETTAAVADLAGRSCDALEDGSVSCKNGFLELGGVPRVFSVNYYYNDRLYAVVGNFHGSWFGTMLAAFTAKYGQPVTTVSDWQNQAGATFKNDVATWRFQDGTLILERMGDDRDYSSFEFTNPAGVPPAVPPTVNF